MTEKIALPTKECRGVDLPDLAGNPTGKIYRSRTPGYIEVDNAAHARGIRQMLGRDSNTLTAFGETPVEACPTCGGLKFLDQEICGRCYARDGATN